MTKPKLYMLVGVPGSGKSTWIGQFMRNRDPKDWVVLSSDNYIEKMAELEGKTYSQVFQKYVKDASKNLQREKFDAIREGKNVIWDQTNLNSSDRTKKLVDFDLYEKVAVFFNVPEDLEKRLANRPGKEIPPFVINNMIMNLTKPTVSEGFNEIIGD